MPSTKFEARRCLGKAGRQIHVSPASVCSKTGLTAIAHARKHHLRQLSAGPLLSGYLRQSLPLVKRFCLRHGLSAARLLAKRYSTAKARVPTSVVPTPNSTRFRRSLDLIPSRAAGSKQHGVRLPSSFP